MDKVLVLVAAPGAETLTPALVARAVDSVAGAGAVPGPRRWLSPERALEMEFGGLSLAGADAAARAALAGRKVDVMAVPAKGRRKRLLVADMDSTMVTGETLDELAGFAGIKAHVAAITARAMNGEIGFEAALRERVGLLEGLSEDCLARTWERVAFTGGARTLVRTMKAYGAHAILVSGGFGFFTAKVRDACGFDRDIANELVVEDGKLTGRVGDTIIGREAKLATLNAASAELGLTPADAVAVGDGANDLDMLLAAGLGVAFHAKPVVAARARFRVEHGDLTALLYAQGYSDGEMVAD